MMTKPYLVLEDLPSVPEQFIKEACQHLLQAVNENQCVTSSSPYSNRTIKKGGRELKPVRTQRFKMSEEFREWLREHVAKEFGETTISRCATNESQCLGAHTDWSRNFLLIYVLKNGGERCRTCWYDIDPATWVRKDSNGQTWVEDYDMLEVRDWITMPLHKWVIINGTTMHGVEHITEDRITFQIGIQDPAHVRSSLI